jgi:hypothetical protein
MIDRAMQRVVRVQEETTTNAYVDGVLVWSQLAGAAAELQERDECKWQLKRQYHLQEIQSKRTSHQMEPNYSVAIVPNENSERVSSTVPMQ